MRLKSRGIVPFGGGFAEIVDPLTGIAHSGLQFDNVLESVMKSRCAMGVPIGSALAEEVERWICQKYPQECVDVDPKMPRKAKLGMMDVLHGTLVLSKFTSSGKKLVSQEEAERRAQICLRCPMNGSFSRPCSGVCAELKDLVLSIVGNRRTSVDSRLFACHVCHCFLGAAVYMPLETQCSGVTDKMREQFAYMAGVSNCWKQCA